MVEECWGCQYIHGEEIAMDDMNGGKGGMLPSALRELKTYRRSGKETYLSRGSAACYQPVRQRVLRLWKRSISVA